MATVCRICKRGISHRGRTAIYCDTCRDSRTRELNRQAVQALPATHHDPLGRFSRCRLVRRSHEWSKLDCRSFSLRKSGPHT